MVVPETAASCNCRKEGRERRGDKGEWEEQAEKQQTIRTGGKGAVGGCRCSTTEEQEAT